MPLLIVLSLLLETPISLFLRKVEQWIYAFISTPSDGLLLIVPTYSLNWSLLCTFPKGKPLMEMLLYLDRFPCTTTILCVHARSVTSVMSNSEITWTRTSQAPLSRDFLGKNTGVGCHALLQEPSWPRDWTCISCKAGRFFTTEPPGNTNHYPNGLQNRNITNVSPNVINFLLWLLQLSLTFQRLWDPSPQYPQIFKALWRNRSNGMCIERDLF